jgi:hypothetical protein
MIPANVDHVGIIQDLNAWGIADFKIEMICGFSRGYVCQLKKNPNIRMTYQLGARLYNFWDGERQLQESYCAQTLAATT